MKPVLKTVAALAVLGIVGAASVVGLGLYNVSARQDHLPGVGWVLHTTYKQSVRLRAPAATEIPSDLQDPDRILLGALHFQTTCAFCHSVPGRPQNATALSMNPPPPHIAEAVATWEPQHLFWIVREGVKMSGMPHWPAEDREDEVWSVVAYLDRLRDMDPQDHAVLIGDTDGRASCSACHGENGVSTNSHVPRLDILTPDQIAQALRQYRDGTRPSGIMREVASGLEESRIDRLAAHFGTASDEPVEIPDRTDPGWLLASRGTEDAPACVACHGPGRTADAPISPRLAGQGRAYLETQLKLWRDGSRGGGARAELMEKAAQGLSDAAIGTLAAWYAGLRPSTLD